MGGVMDTRTTYLKGDRNYSLKTAIISTRRVGVKTFNRICIKDFVLTAQNGDCLQLQRGREYLTSPEENGKVVVFTNFWVPVPVELFAGEKVFTT
jgi:hypothetical protein